VSEHVRSELGVAADVDAGGLAYGADGLQWVSTVAFADAPRA